jgi:hypothetical protein
MARKIKPSYFITGLIVVYAILYEWAIFEADALSAVVNVAKIVIPCLMLILIPPGKSPSRSSHLFAMFFLLFMIWGLGPSLFSREYQEAAATWLKYAPRLLFTFLVGLYLIRQPQACIQLTKVFIILGVVTVGQFVLLIAAYSVDLASPFFVAGTIHYGPLGILGNQSAVMYLSELPFPIFRLTGFWHEPSNASGFLFAGFFLARMLYALEKKLIWKVSRYICLVGGFLALSNAGYLALAAPMFFAAMFSKKSGIKIVHVCLLAVLSVSLMYFALQGRTLVTTSYSGSGELKALAGARAGTEIDPYSGRIDLLRHSLDVLISQPFGIGMRISGEGHYEEASASAPVQWLTYTGFVGLILLLLREWQVLSVAIKFSKESVLIMTASQAWLAIFTQHLAYGTWMTPVYLLLCLIVLTMAYHVRRGTFGDQFLDGAAATKEVPMIVPPRRRILDQAAARGLS